MIITVPAFIAKKNFMKSTTAEIISVGAETEKSFRLVLRSQFRESSACWRCGKAITNEHSLHWGVGPDCADSLGLPWNELPEERPDVSKESDVELFFPKRFLDDDQIAKLKEQVKNNPQAKAASGARLWIEDGCLMLTSPYVNRTFVDELAALPGRKWLASVKANSFDETEEAFSLVVNALARWKVEVTFDKSVSKWQKQKVKRDKDAAKDMADLGVETIDDLKYIEVSEDLEFGLKTEPWGHQRQAISWAYRMMTRQTLEEKP